MQKLGLSLIVISFVPWVAILFVPLLALTLAQKAALVPILAIIAEVLFWLGILIVGKEAATKYRQYLPINALWRSLKKWYKK
jgi:hypothetical protein